MSFLEAQGLVKSFKNLTVVDQVDLKVNSGEVVGLLGPNGAGKTTCFYIICGLIRKDAGTIHLDQREISNLPMHQRARLGVGYLPQEPSIFRRLTVEQNILAVLQLQPNLKTAGIEEILERLLNQMNINDLRNTLGISLSGGERRRVEIARTLATRPKFILLDEPFAGVDPISVLDIQN